MHRNGTRCFGEILGGSTLHTCEQQGTDEECGVHHHQSSRKNRGEKWSQREKENETRTCNESTLHVVLYMANQCNCNSSSTNSSNRSDVDAVTFLSRATSDEIGRHGMYCT